MTAASRWTAKQPDRMECYHAHHPLRRHVTSPLCVLQELEAEDFVHTMCDAQDEEEKRHSLHTDPQTCRLNDLFVRAHGLPRGEYTIFSNAMDASTIRSKTGLR
jgi:hypothetical protein